jgi:hypothetical protein
MTHGMDAVLLIEKRQGMIGRLRRARDELGEGEELRRNTDRSRRLTPSLPDGSQLRLYALAFSDVVHRRTHDAQQKPTPPPTQKART